MTKILKISDRIPVHIGDILFKISPLTYLQKMEIQDHMVDASGGNLKAAMAGAHKALKYAIKGVEGIEDYSGKSYELSFGEDKYLTDECVDDLLNLDQSDTLITVCAALLNGLPKKEMLHPKTGKPLEGVSIGKIEGNA